MEAGPIDGAAEGTRRVCEGLRAPRGRSWPRAGRSETGRCLDQEPQGSEPAGGAGGSWGRTRVPHHLWKQAALKVKVEGSDHHALVFSLGLWVPWRLPLVFAHVCVCVCACTLELSIMSTALHPFLLWRCRPVEREHRAVH